MRDESTEPRRLRNAKLPLEPEFHLDLLAAIKYGGSGMGKKTKKKMGRPPKKNPRYNRFTVRLSKKEAAVIKEKAEAAGMGIAEYLRFRALEG